MEILDINFERPPFCKECKTLHRENDWFKIERMFNTTIIYWLCRVCSHITTIDCTIEDE